MENKTHLGHFLSIFMHPRVLVFFIIGSTVIFLTFLTNNNAIEIVISGFASVFIGIAVNNFSSFETHSKDEEKIKRKIAHSLKVMEITRSRIKLIHSELDIENDLKTKEQLVELEQIIVLSMALIKDEETLS